LVGKLSAEEQTTKKLTIFQKSGGIKLALSRFNDAVNDFTSMLQQAQAMRDPAMESAALNAMTLSLCYSHRLTEMAERAEESLSVAERAESEWLRVETMQLIGLKDLCYGQLGEAKTMLDEVIQVARSIDHKQVLVSGLG